MIIYSIGNGKFATGKLGQKATRVVRKRGEKYVGVPGRRPLLVKGRYEKVTTTPELVAALSASK